MNGTLVISIDFELMWGVRDHLDVTNYGRNIIGGRDAIVGLLRLFNAFNVRATWATVGLLFARNRDEMIDHIPVVLPRYNTPSLSPFTPFPAEVGRDENEDPLHFGESLIRRISDHEGNEVASHTYGHLFCLEPGATVEALNADLDSARAIAGLRGYRLESLVFPRNQFNSEHLKLIAEHGFTCYRGTTDRWIDRPVPAVGQSLAKRGLRLLDAIIPVGNGTPHQESGREGPSMDCRASRFLRFRTPPGIPLELHLNRVRKEMTFAARSGRTYHLWFHPHNLGHDAAGSLAIMDGLLCHFRTLREKYGMKSLNMSDISRSRA